jgi:hypothetical protein
MRMRQTFFRMGLFGIALTSAACSGAVGANESDPTEATATEQPSGVSEEGSGAVGEEPSLEVALAPGGAVQPGPGGGGPGILPGGAWKCGTDNNSSGLVGLCNYAVSPEGNVRNAIKLAVPIFFFRSVPGVWVNANVAESDCTPTTGRQLLAWISLHRAVAELSDVPQRVRDAA